MEKVLFYICLSRLYYWSVFYIPLLALIYLELISSTKKSKLHDGVIGSIPYE